MCLLLAIIIYCKNINRTKPISKLSLPPYLIAIVYLSLQSLALIMAEIGIDGDFGSLHPDDTVKTGTFGKEVDVDWNDRTQWLIRIYYSVRFLKVASFYAFLNQESFHKLVYQETVHQVNNLIESLVNRGKENQFATKK